MNCIYCEKEIPEKANFCPNCKQQVKCLNCAEQLEKDSEICIICGEDKKHEIKNQNTIEFNETKKTRNFKASFSNDVGQSIGEALGIILSNKRGNVFEKKILTTSPINSIEHKELVEDTEFSEVPNTSTSENKINDIFKDNDGKITLMETRLKANSKRDYSIRLTIIFLYYRLLKGYDKVLRSDLTSIIQDASVYDGNFRHWLTTNNLVSIHDDFVELKAPGREKAKEYIDEIYDITKEDKWKLGSTAKKRRKKEEDKEL